MINTCELRSGTMVLFIDEEISLMNQKFNTWSDIPEKEFNYFLSICTQYQLKKGELFLKAGEIPDRIAFILSGLLRHFYVNQNGNECTKYFGVENTFGVSYGSFLQQTESKFYIDALENTRLLTFRYDDYLNLLERNTCWQVFFRKFAEIILISESERLSNLLLDNATERYRKFISEYPLLEQRIKQYHVASYLGISPPSLSRIRSSLQKNY